MRLSTGRWVSGDDFFNREAELRVLEARVRDGNSHRFPSRLLKDWWAARFRDHHTPLQSRMSAGV